MMQPGPFLSAKENDDAFPISKTPPPKKKKNSEVSTSFTLLARYPTWSNWNSWQLDVADPRHPGLAFGWREATGRKEAPTVEAHPGW